MAQERELIAYGVWLGALSASIASDFGELSRAVASLALVATDAMDAPTRTTRYERRETRNGLRELMDNGEWTLERKRMAAGWLLTSHFVEGNPGGIEILASLKQPFNGGTNL